MRFLVCGSRTFDNYELLDAELLAASVIHGEPTLIINGGMTGADALSSFWAYENDINTLCFGAQWGDHKSAAGPIRNAQMLDEGKPDVVFAFYDKPRSSSRGTANMVTHARRAGIEVVEVDA